MLAKIPKNLAALFDTKSGKRSGPHKPLFTTQTLCPGLHVGLGPVLEGTTRTKEQNSHG
jgi:hypothetical protein